ncbi:probable serine/threonine-protein kinase dyrk2 [Lucilia cuprina]|uniref:probable serine/threonine-protein kinase dyrk2 n=1 Tax=Lucilia cuprina TaxID=7375 RepID=UPI001F05945D|nr:probable serine/threonine-protein kinase dyrk2 [Lucilia cuprina]
MLLAMRRETEHHHHTTVPTVAATVTGAVATSSLNLAATSSSGHNNHNLTLSTSNAGSSDSLNTPSTPLLNLGRSPLQFTAPPPPPPPITVQPGPQFGFYTPAPAAASSYFHHYTHAAPTYAPPTTSVGVHAASNGSYVASSESCRNVAPPSEELEEFVDIFQVQHLLLDHSAANGNQPPPHSLMPMSSSAPVTASVSSALSTESQTTTTTSTSTTSTTTATSLAKPQPRPRLNLQKASEYAAQHQADSPSSRRMLLDYPSPYLYGNHYHTSPSEDLVALWFGSNGSGEFMQNVFIKLNYFELVKYHLSSVVQHFLT